MSDLYDQLKGGAGLNLATSVAEGHQVSKMMSSMLKVSSVLHRFHPKQWGNTWLEWQYGVRPLLSDVYNSANQILTGQRNGVTHIVGKSKDVFDWRKEVDVEGTAKERMHILQSTRYKIHANFQIPESRWLELAGFTSLNPAALAWELLPYSFVADWFLDIGQYLANVENFLLYHNYFKGGYMTLTIKNVVESTLVGGRNYGPGQKSYSRYNAKATYRGIRKDRTLLIGLPFPNLPHIRADLGSSRLISAASLLSQFLGKGK
jgi:hypothetical protein